jgi:2-polyprenyl-6-methoxyphenol hydroxylase-like FAD-dependent oxidoreductase
MSPMTSENSFVVVGGSMTGMLAARVLADYGPVTILERDPLPQGGEARRGVPQAPHLHALLARGLGLLEQWFPGLRSELLRDGAVLADGGKHVGWLGPYGWAPPVKRGALESVWFTRDFLDAHVRDRLRSHPNIGWLEGTRVEGLLLHPSRRAVQGVRLRDGQVRRARLVVDASGRGSKLPDWLREAGITPARETEIDARTVYSTALVRLARPLPNGWKVIFVLGAAPTVLRGAAMSLVEGGRAMVTALVLGGQPCPEDPASMVAHGMSLRSHVIGHALADAEWLGPVRTTRSTTNRRRYYERTPLPAGLLVMGDALCSFNPIYGQGMTVAAMQAEALGRLLRRVPTDHELLGPKANRNFGKVADFPWVAATGSDLRIPGTIGEAPAGMELAQSYMNRLFAAALTDEEVNRRVSHVLNLMESPLSLYSPRMIWAALRQGAPEVVLGPVDVPRIEA